MRILLSFLLLFSIAACDQADARTKHFQKFLNQDVNHFTVTDLYGNKVNIQTLLAETQKPIVLNLWATWCPPCIKEMPDLIKLAEQRDFNVVTLSVDKSASDVDRFFRSNSMTSQTLYRWHDPFGKAQKEVFGVTQYPTTYLIDIRGITKRVYLGPREWPHKSMVKKMKTDLGLDETGYFHWDSE